MALLVAVGIGAPQALGHVFIPESFRLGGYPAYEGSGWFAEVYLNIPDDPLEEHPSCTSWAANLNCAEEYIAGREPSFTFRTDWIDFPAGPVAVDLDENFATIGDFIAGHAYDVSEPTQLDKPFGHFLIRFSGYLRVLFEDDVVSGPGLPIWVDFGTIGYDGFRLLVGQTIYRFPQMFLMDDEPSFFWRENPICDAAGMFRIEFYYFNRYDTDPEPDPPGQSVFHAEYAGVELYTWHGGGLAWPAGENMIHEVRGPGTIIPPWVIYQADDVQPLVIGDFDADGDHDVEDLRWFQACFSGPIGEDPLPLETGCHWFDFDKDVDVDLNDYAALLSLVLEGR